MKRTLIALVFLAVATLLVNYARGIDWPAVAAAMRALPSHAVIAAAGCAAASYLVYCSYDLIGRHQVGHHLAVGQVAAVGFVSYAFNLSLGAWVGGIALRYRLYSRLGLGVETITQILALSLVSNWLGYLFLAGSVFVFRPLALPGDWAFGSDGLRIIGAALLALAAAYVALCFGAGRRRWHVRGHAFTLPSGPLALVQLTLSVTNWMLIAGVIAVLLGGKVDYSTVLSVLLVAAVAGVIAHVPAGLGVLEAVFIALISSRVPLAELLAALLGYRALYYLAPLGLAIFAYLALEARAGPGTVAVRAQARHDET